MENIVFPDRLFSDFVMGSAEKEAEGFPRKSLGAAFLSQKFITSSLHKLMRIQIHHIRFLLELSDFHFQNFLGLGMYVLITADFLEVAFTYSELQATSIILKSSKLSEEYVLRMIKREATEKFSFIHEKNNHTAGCNTGGTHWDAKNSRWSSCHWLRLCQIYLK